MLRGDLDFVTEGLCIDATGDVRCLYKMEWVRDRVKLKPWLTLDLRAGLKALTELPYSIAVEFVPGTLGRRHGKFYVDQAGRLYQPFRV